MKNGFVLASDVIALAGKAKLTVGTAESLTAGLIAATLAQVPGASQVLLGGIVSYAPQVKHDLLGVSQAVIDSVGVVSEPCARQMADGARVALNVDIAVSATGIAGPDGGTVQTPVGTAFIGCAGKHGTVVREHHFSGDRQAVRDQTVEAALIMVLDMLKA